MNCLACQLPINSFEFSQFYCDYGKIAQGAGMNCPRCSLVLQCIRTGTAGVHVPEDSPVYGPKDNPYELSLQYGRIQLEIFTNHVGDSSPYTIPIKNHLPGATDSPTTFATIQSWIKECTTTHEECHYNHPVAYPKRLVDVNGELVILRQNIQPARYACLSHCWGSTTDMVKTTTNNLNDFMTNIPWDQLSATYRDAITICRRLGIFYLWIDSLCIIQDSKDDWKDQASQMADIYESSFITIAATRSNDGSEGCFADRDEKYLAKLVPGYRNIYIRHMPPSFPSASDLMWGLKSFPLLSRGWIYQEMRLSQRILHFCANEVVWLCQTVQRSESGRNDHHFSDRRVFRNKLYEDVPYSILRQDPRYLWYRTVQEYSRLQLTFESDKMPALAGLTKRMETMRPGDRYLAGLWEGTLLFDLLWMASWERRPGIRRKGDPQFPSWSWASVSRQVKWSPHVKSTLDSVRVKEVRYITTGPSHLGEVSEATITIQAPLIDARMLLSKQRNASTDPRHENITMAEQLYVYCYEADCLRDASSATRSKSDLSGFVVPIGVSALSNVFIAVHIQQRPGSKYYERVGYIEISHPSQRKCFDEKCDPYFTLSHAQQAKYTAAVKQFLQSLPTSTLVLV